MTDLKRVFRWHGPEDPVSLEYIRQIPGIIGVTSSLYHMPLGQVWPMDQVLKIRAEAQQYGLTMEIMDSFRIHEDIKLGRPNRDLLMEAYKENVRRLGEAGIRVICYNFMPVFDATRTDMAYPLPDGSTTLAYDHKIVATCSPAEAADFIPGLGAGRSKEEILALMEDYKGVNEEDLWENLAYFLRGILPVAEEAGVKLAIHHDDPPFSIFGIPRIMKNLEDMRRLVEISDSPSNGFTLCTGSAGSIRDNCIPQMIREMGSRIFFIHFRNVKIQEEGFFYEAGHATSSGSLDMAEIMKAIVDMDYQGYIRPDHGRMIWGETGVPGYGLYDRALGVAYMNGLYEALKKRKGEK